MLPLAPGDWKEATLCCFLLSIFVEQECGTYPITHSTISLVMDDNNNDDAAVVVLFQVDQ